jgi:hypothetical protein
MPTDQPIAPIVTLGPCGSGFVSLDPTVEQALAHLDGHSSPDGEPVPDSVVFYDGHARRLTLGTQGRPTFELTDHRVREGELKARMTETVAHAREHLYRDPSLLESTGLRDPGQCRSPAEDLPIDQFLAELTNFLAAAPREDAHSSSWWHNLFHRL